MPTEAEKRNITLVLTDGITTVRIGTFKAATVGEAEKQARKRYAATFRRLKLPNWRVVESDLLG